MMKPSASVTIEAAAELAKVDVLTVRRWSHDGLLQIQRTGDMEAVRLADVHALAATKPSRTWTQLGTLRGLLRESTRAESFDVTGLQELVRQRGTSKRRRS